MYSINIRNNICVAKVLYAASYIDALTFHILQHFFSYYHLLLDQ